MARNKALFHLTCICIMLCAPSDGKGGALVPPLLLLLASAMAEKAEWAAPAALALSSPLPGAAEALVAAVAARVACCINSSRPDLM